MTNPIWNNDRYQSEKPGQLVDANDKPIHLAFWANLETGEVWHNVPEDSSIDVAAYIAEHKRPPPIIKDALGNGVTGKTVYPSPLRFVPD